VTRVNKVFSNYHTKTNRYVCLYMRVETTQVSINGSDAKSFRQHRLTGKTGTLNCDLSRKTSTTKNYC